MDVEINGATFNLDMDTSSLFALHFGFLFLAIDSRSTWEHLVFEF